MIKLEYWNEKAWNAAGEFPSDRIAWLSLGEDNDNYRTLDEAGDVITDRGPDTKVEPGSTLNDDRDQGLSFALVVDALVDSGVLEAGWELRIGPSGPGAVWVLYSEPRNRYLAFPNDRELSGPLLDLFIQTALANAPETCRQVCLADPFPGNAPSCPVCGRGTFHRSTGWACLSILPGRK